MPRDPLAWLPLMQHWTRCLGEGGHDVARLGDLDALPDLDMAALLPGGPGWMDVQRSLRHDPRRSVSTALLRPGGAGAGGAAGAGAAGATRERAAPRTSVLIPVHNHWDHAQCPAQPGGDGQRHQL
jgi:hypothetical protein